MTKATTQAVCTICPGHTPADGTITDRNGELRGVCSTCVLLVWRRDWNGVRDSAWRFQMGQATGWEKLRHGIRARRRARIWARCVEVLCSEEARPR